MTHTVEEARRGTYAEPFTLTQYGVFVVGKDGYPRFIAASVVEDDALRKAEEHYHHMNQFEHNDMDMSEIDRFYIRTRTLTYGVWNDS